MNAANTHLHDRLVAGRAALDEFTRTRPEPQLLDLLQRIDTTLQQLHNGTWGVCGVCHESISPAGMEEHPLVSICLECMTEAQRTALEYDLKSAAKVQRALLPPTTLSHDGWDVSYIWEPFGAVSGDHIDLVQPPSTTDPFHLLLGDVAGKGVAASLLQSQLHALLRALTDTQTTLSNLIGRANNLFFEGTSASNYATLTAVRLYPDGRAVLSNAGHPRPLLADRRGVRPIEDASIPLGMLADAEYPEREIQLRQDDTLLLYTDGWTEAEYGDEEYGVGRAAAAFRRARKLPLRDLLASCRDDLATFLNGESRGDDLTLVAVRRTSNGVYR